MELELAYYKKISYPPLSKKHIEQVTNDYNNVVKKYGKNIKNDYGWASVALGRDKPSMFDIESDIGFDIYRPFHRMACHNVHGGVKGLSFKLSDRGKSYPSLNAGSSMFGFTDPAHTTAISLYHAANAFFNVYHSINWDMWLRFILIFSEYIGDSFVEIQQHDEV